MIIDETVVCPACEHSTLADRSTCGYCGAALAGASRPSPTPTYVPSQEPARSNRVAIALVILAVAVAGYIWYSERPHANPPGTQGGTHQQVLSVNVGDKSVDCVNLRVCTYPTGGGAPKCESGESVRYTIQLYCAIGDAATQK